MSDEGFGNGSDKLSEASRSIPEREVEWTWLPTKGTKKKNYEGEK